MKKHLSLACLVVAFVCINSCKKDSQYATTISQTKVPGTVSSAEIMNWFAQMPQVEPAGALLRQAQQQVINGQQVVRIPVGTNAALYFTKENDSLKVYAQKWVYSGVYTNKYTGKIDVYDFQRQNFKRYIYSNGALTAVKMLVTTSTLTVSSSLKVSDIWTGISKIWCYITGGVWCENGDCPSGGAKGEVGMPGCDRSSGGEDTGGDVPLPEYVYIDDSGDVYFDGGNGGSGAYSPQAWGPPPCPPGSGPTVSAINQNRMSNMPLPPDDGGCPSAPDGSAWQQYSIFGLNTFAASLINTLNITDNATEAFLLFNKDLSYDLYIYLQQAGDSPDTESQLNWSINYLMANPAVSVDVFANQFLSIPEGTDGPDAYDSSYWDDPNLQLPQQALPSYQSFHDNFPNIPAADVYNLVGGQILANRNANPTYYQDACALRVSRALNYSSVIIPAVKGTQTGADGLNYFLSAKTLNAWLNKTFGPPTYHFTKAQLGTNGENFPALANGKKGIYSMVASNWIATGHADLFFGTDCARGCDITPKTDYIDIWVLP